MRLLLDTPIALWAITDDPRLGATACDAILSATTIGVSVASLWEIAIKHGLGRGDMPIGSADAEGYFRTAGYDILPIQARHVHRLAELAPLHRDPFDRLLVAHAVTDNFTLVTDDPIVASYGAGILRA